MDNIKRKIADKICVFALKSCNFGVYKTCPPQVIATEGSEVRKEKDNKMIHKIPKWETEEFTPEDRKYEYSSYAIDVQEKEKKIKKVGELITRHLKKGKIYSYKELCELIGDTPQTSSDKRYNQQRKWECYFEFIPIKRKGFQITRIYKTPKYENYITAKEIKDITNEQHKYIYQVLLMLLYNPSSNPDCDFYEFRATKWHLFRLLGFANELFFKNCLWPGDYKDAEHYVPRKMSGVERKFYNDAMQYFSKLLERALFRLHVCKKINYYWETKVIDAKTKKERFATRTEAILITKIEGEVLNGYNAENIYEIADNGEKLSSFKQKVMSICGEQLGITNYWDEIDIWVAKTNVRTGIMRMYQRFKGRGSDITEMQREYQTEGATMMNQLIANYFYELNTKSAERYAEYLFKESGKEVAGSDISFSYGIIKMKRDEMVKRYIEIKDYFNTIRQPVLYRPKVIDISELPIKTTVDKQGVVTVTTSNNVIDDDLPF